MKAILMAGGEGSRLRPLTIGRPKPMVPVVNKAVISHILDLLKLHGITDVIITLRYLASAIQDFLDDGSSIGMNLQYAVEDTPLGTAGSVKNSAHLLDDDPFMVISGDSLADFDLGAIIAAHHAAGTAATLTLTPVENPLEYGVIVTNAAGLVTQFLEKPTWSEVLSDTVNTSIYVLNPEVLDLIPTGQKYDFSKDLFPKMMAAGMPLHGHVAEGYWCDVGSLEEYQRATADMLHGRVNLPEPIGTHVGGDVWVGRDVEISPNAQLYGPIFLGNEVKIKGDVVIHGPTVIRDYTVIDNHTRIERSILWRNNYVGESCELHGVIVSRQCSIKSKVVAQEGVVIGDGCAIGEGAALGANVKLWPHKEIEAGATIKESIIWRNQGRRSLFSRFGISGVVNIEVTPEFAAKVGAALGATLPRGSMVAVNRDIHRGSRMIKRAMISGLPGSGINVWDLGSVAIPVARHFVRTSEETGAGIHVRLSPFDQRVIDIRLMDEVGMNLSHEAERMIERVYFREDFRRAYFNEIGLIDYVQNPIDRYTRDFLEHVNVDLIRDQRFKIVVDYSYGLATETLADILTKLNVDVVAVNSHLDESKLAMLQEEFTENRMRMAKIVTALGADLGIQYDVGGEKIYIVDNRGRTLDTSVAAALMMELVSEAAPGSIIAAPIDVSNVFDKIAAWHECQLLRVSNNLHTMMMAAEQESVVFAFDAGGNFIFPDFQPAVDGLIAGVRLLEHLARRQTHISDVIDYLPAANIIRERLTCSWGTKGRIMRMLNEEHRDHNLEKIDGVKIHLNEGEWIHISPDPELPQCTFTAEAVTIDRARELIAEYRERVSGYMAKDE